MTQAERWGRSPKFFLRADAIGALTRDWAVGRFLEVGAGTGEMTTEFLQRRFSGTVYDLGDETRAGLRRRFAGDPSVTVVDAIDEVRDESVDFLLAFEVLEHIDDDSSALQAWTRKLKRGGALLVSVPAHQRKFSETDRRVGHVRRYERAALRALIAGAGYESIDVACYGFPLGNVGRIAGNLLERRIAADPGKNAVDRSIDSGTQQSSAVVGFSRIVRPWMLRPFFAMQRATFGFDIGDGYIACAVRSA